MHLIVLTNPAAGARADLPDAIRQAFQNAGAEIELRQVAGADLTAAARAALEQNPDVIVAAGGDGTVSAVAAVLAGASIPLGVLPTGTLNHFARDLGIPLIVPLAAQAIVDGIATPIDVADLNGRVFINNSSIGLYPRIVDRRDRQRQRLGRGKWMAMLMAFIRVFRRYPTVRVRIGVGDESVPRTTPFVFVGNNRYEITFTQIGKRTALNRGELSLYFANRTGRFGLLRLALRAVLGRLEQARDFDALTAAEAWIETDKPDLCVAIDGEVVRLTPPLHYTTRPGALRVMLPRSEAHTQGLASATATDGAVS